MPLSVYQKRNRYGGDGKGDAYPNGDRAALSALFGRQRMWFTQVGTPVTSTDGDDAQLSDNDGGADGGRDFLGGLDSETDVAFRVSNHNNGLESSSLTSAGLLLDGFDL